MVEKVHQVIYNVLATKGLDNNFFDYIDPWGENLSYIMGNKGLLLMLHKVHTSKICLY